MSTTPEIGHGVAISLDVESGVVRIVLATIRDVAFAQAIGQCYPNLIRKPMKETIVSHGHFDGAFVISSMEAFNAPSGHSLMAMMASAAHAPWPFDVAIPNGDAAGLSTAFVVGMKVFTINSRFESAKTPWHSWRTLLRPGKSNFSAPQKQKPSPGVGGGFAWVSLALTYFLTR